MDNVFVELERNALNLRVLDTLCISQLKLGSECIVALGMAIQSLPELKHLDVSATGLNGFDVHQLLSSIAPQNRLRSLNLSYNSAK
jgi:hypothetical protein